MSLRLGILGAASIAASSVIGPARLVEDVAVVAIAARDPRRAADYGTRHGIPRHFGGAGAYAELLADPGVDAVYVPLPNSLHGEWTIRALDAGKHVLTEKPWTANAMEARSVAATAARHPELVTMEAFHYRYHPLTARVLEVVASGELGELRHVSATLCVPMPPSPRNIRWSLPLGGGSLMDLGCYAVHQVRTLAGAEPEVVSAQARQTRRYPGIDRWVRAELAFPGGIEGAVTVAMWSGTLLSLRADVVGSAGSLRVTRLLSPQFLARLAVRTPGRRWSEGTTRRPSYAYQLEAFRDAIAGDRSRVLTGPADSVANMVVIDAIYAAAGMVPRMPLGSASA